MPSHNRPAPGSTAAVNLGSDYTADELEFLRAMEAYRQVNRRPFPSFTEVLAVAKSLGYRRVEPAGPLPGRAPGGRR